MKSFIVIAVLLSLFSCKKNATSDVPAIKQYYINQRFSIALNETVSVLDTFQYVSDTTSGKKVHPLFILTYSNVISDNRKWGALGCGSSIYGVVVSKVIVKHFNIVDSQLYTYEQCTNFDSPLLEYYPNYHAEHDTLFMLRTHPLTIDNSSTKENSGYSMEMIFINRKQ